MTTTYLAEIQFANGKSATAKDNNLRILKARIKRNFAGEQTEWAYDPSETRVASGAVFHYSEDRERLVWEYVAK